LGGHGAERVAGLEREGLLDRVYGGEVVVFDLAELQKAIQGVMSAMQREERRTELMEARTHFSHIFGT